MRRTAFTLIELLVVIGIIAILAGLLLAGLNTLGTGSKRAKTGVIIESVRQALELCASQQGGYPGAAEHPLAGSAGTATAPRAVFRRDAAEGSTLLDSAAATTALALTGVQPGNLPPAARDRLLLRSDRFADRRMPLLFGLPREALGVLGAPQRDITRYRRLPRQATPTTLIPDPDATALFPDERCLVAPSDGPDANQRALDFAFGTSGAKAELVRLGALGSPDESGGGLIVYGRAWSSAGSEPAIGDSAWWPGTLRDPQQENGSAGPRWIPYRLRGLSVGDAWGREILYSLSLGGVTRLISAGADGVFRWHPGADGILQSEIDALAGDDRDGAADNIQLAVGGDVR